MNRNQLKELIHSTYNNRITSKNNTHVKANTFNTRKIISENTRTNLSPDGLQDYKLISPKNEPKGKQLTLSQVFSTSNDRYALSVVKTSVSSKCFSEKEEKGSLLFKPTPVNIKSVKTSDKSVLSLQNNTKSFYNVRKIQQKLPDSNYTVSSDNKNSYIQAAEKLKNPVSRYIKLYNHKANITTNFNNLSKLSPFNKFSPDKSQLEYLKKSTVFDHEKTRQFEKRPQPMYKNCINIENAVNKLSSGTINISEFKSILVRNNVPVDDILVSKH